MADREYIYTPPTVNNAIGGDAKTGTKWNEAWVASDAVKLNALFSKIAGDMNFVLSMIGATSTDTLNYSWSSVDAVTVHPGLAIADDGTQHEVANDTLLTLDANLDTGTRAADTIYFIWIGEDSVTGLTKLLISESYDTAPTNLLHAYRLRNFFNTLSASSNIEQFIEALPDDWPPGLYMHDAPYKPAGCHWAHGQEVSRTHAAYSRLFARYGTSPAWGTGDGSTTFNLPDTQGRSPIGAGQGSGLPLVGLGEYLGEWEHQLTITEMPIHNHAEDGKGGTTCAAGNYAYAPYSRKATGNAGGDEPHNTVHTCFGIHFVLKG